MAAFVDRVTVHVSAGNGGHGVSSVHREKVKPPGGPDGGKGTQVFSAPSFLGGKNWQPMSFSPQTGYVYIPSNNVCMDMVDTPVEDKRGAFFRGKEKAPNAAAYGHIPGAVNVKATRSRGLFTSPTVILPDPPLVNAACVRMGAANAI